jgi:hypothetical protein
VLENYTSISYRVLGHLLREYLTQLIGAVGGVKAPGVVALGFPPRRHHPWVSQSLYIVPSMTQYNQRVLPQTLSTNMVSEPGFES